MPNNEPMEDIQNSPIPERHKGLWEFCLSVGLRGSQDLRQKLGLDETNFRHVASYAHAEPSRCFIYRVLDEIQKAGISMMQWKEYVSKGIDCGGLEADQGLKRLALQSVIDDQQFKARKLAETLVDSILFSTTNAQEYFRDFYYLSDLNQSIRHQQDRQAFFAFQSKNTAYHADWLCQQIQSLEAAGLDVKKRWYLAKPGPVQKQWTTKGVNFSSFRQRYIAVLPVALPSEMAILGKSYIHAYGSSKDVHFTAHDISSSFEPSEILLGVDKVGILILALVIRCQYLLGIVPEGVNKQYREMHDGNTAPSELVDTLKAKPAEVGDIVWVQGDLAEVLSVTESAYGYTAYHVKYIERPPLPEVSDDYFAGFEIRLITKKTLIDHSAEELGKSIQMEKGVTPSGEQLREYVLIPTLWS
jgi:hypothetical protein